MTTDDRWRPNATVATVITRQGRFLVVEEHDRDTGQRVINQPAGHIELGESLTQAAEREVLEETGWRVIVHAYLGVGRLQAANGVTYLRHTFVAHPISEIGQHELDEGIIAVHWMTYEELLSCRDRHRSPLVMQVVELFIQGAQASLSLVLDA